jgi:hypothetical protein
MPARKLAGALVLCAALAACSGSTPSGVSAGTYVKSLCQAVVLFKQDVQTRTQRLRSLPKGTSMSNGKKALEGFLSGAVADADAALTKLNAAGTPNVKNGEAAQRTIVGAFTRLKGALAKARAAAASLSTTNAQAFQTGTEKLALAITSSVNQVSPSLSNFQSAELEAAAAKEPACRSIGS